MVVKIEVMHMQIKEMLQDYIMCDDKGDLKGFQPNFETFIFTIICHNLTPVN